MSLNPKVAQDLKGVENIEVKRITCSIYRYNSKSGKALADAVRYETATGDMIGKGEVFESGELDDRQAVSIITQLFPEFDKECLEYLNQLPEDDRTVRIVFQRYAIYLSEHINIISEEDRDALFEIIEVILTNCSAGLRKMVATDFLEEVQNIFGNNDIDPEQYVKYLRPITKKWWNEINRFWADLEKYYTSNQYGRT